MPARILPFYVVCDQSYSMADHLDALNDGLAQLHAAVGTDPAVADTTMFCLIGFAGGAEVLQPLRSPSDVLRLAGLATQAGTNFGAAFTLLRATIENDVARLKAAAHHVYRPAVFFLSDGHPTDPAVWPEAYERLVDPEWPARPNIIAFGIGDADAATIGRIGTFQAFMSRGGVSPAVALQGFARALTTSVVRSGGGDTDGTDDGGDLMLRVPTQVSGFTALRIERL